MPNQKRFPGQKATKNQDATQEFEQTILQITRVSRTVAGGRRIRFRALVIVGDKNGRVGIGVGKGTEVAGAVQKAYKQGKKKLIKVNITDTGTISHEVTSSYGSAKIIMKPAAEGTSIIAGSTIRAISEAVGIKNLVAKIIGSANKINNAHATINALKQLQNNYIQKNKE